MNLDYIKEHIGTDIYKSVMAIFDLYELNTVKEHTSRVVTCIKHYSSLFNEFRQEVSHL